jgi:preprotein translocase subunit SecA
MFSSMLDGIKEETITHLFHVRVQAAPPPPPAVQPAADRVADDSATQTQPTPVVAPSGSERTARTPVAPGNGAGRHAAPDVDPAATTGVLPAVLGGSAPRRPAELQYTGPAEDGSATRSRSDGAAAAGGRQARGGAAGEPGRNRPCPCGSGRKYKHCHGAPTAARP